MAGADEPDLDALGDLWRRNEPSMDNLAANVRTRAKAAALVAAAELLVAIAASAWALWMFVRGGPTNHLIGTSVLAFAGFALLASWLAHRGAAWIHDGLTVRERLDAAIVQSRAIRRWARAGYATAGAAVILICVVDLGRSTPVQWAATAAALVYVAVAVVIAAWLSSRQKALLERLEGLRAELTSQENNESL